MKKSFLYLVLITLIFGLFAGCVSTEKTVFVLPKLTPPPAEPTPTPKAKATVRPKKTPPPPEMVYASIAEVNEQAGVAVSMILKVGSATRGIKPSLVGVVYNDQALTQRIGRVRLTNVYANLSKAQVLELSHKPNARTAVVVFTINR